MILCKIRGIKQIIFDKYATNHDIPEEPETLKFAHIVAAEQIDDFPDSLFVYIVL